jgi:hypothetical protein
LYVGTWYNEELRWISHIIARMPEKPPPGDHIWRYK